MAHLGNVSALVLLILMSKLSVLFATGDVSSIIAQCSNIQPTFPENPK